MEFLARNADGDELLFIHEGEGDLFCDYGHLAFRDGDYIMLPRSTMWRIEPSSPVTALLIEATNEVTCCRRRVSSAAMRSSIPACSRRPRSTMRSARSWRDRDRRS